jgi:hypothetical protein
MIYFGMVIKILVRFFAVLGVIFFFILLGLGYVIVADPFHLRPLVSLLLAPPPSSGGAVVSPPAREGYLPSTPVDPEDVQGTDDVTSISDSVTPPMPASPNSVPVTSAQAEALESVGLTAAAISPEQEACFVSILGQARVDEVKAGTIPSAAEFVRASGCL